MLYFLAILLIVALSEDVNAIAVNDIPDIAVAEAYCKAYERKMKEAKEGSHFLNASEIQEATRLASVYCSANYYATMQAVMPIFICGNNEQTEKQVEATCGMAQDGDNCSTISKLITCQANVLDRLCHLTNSTQMYQMYYKILADVKDPVYSRCSEEIATALRNNH